MSSRNPFFFTIAKPKIYAEKWLIDTGKWVRDWRAWQMGPLVFILPMDTCQQLAMVFVLLNYLVVSQKLVTKNIHGAGRAV